MENTNKLIDYEEEFLNNPDEMLEPYNPDEMLEPYDIEREKRITE